MKPLIDNDKTTQETIWDYYRFRQIHAWNMFCMARQDLENFNDDNDPFKIEYFWENLIIRMWLYRVTINTLTKISKIENHAKKAVKRFDAVFCENGVNHLKDLRNMIEHFDDYAENKGRGPGQRNTDLDPPREFTKDHYERGRFMLERKKSCDAVIMLQADAKKVSGEFLKWLNPE